MTVPREVTARDAQESAVDESYGWTFWVGLVLGWAVIAYGVWGAFGDEAATNPTELVRWIAAGLLVHDVLLAPVVTAIALLVGRLVPPPFRGPVSAGLVLSGLVVLFSYPLLRGYGRHELNASTLPQDYPRNVVIVLVWIWVAVVVTIAFRWMRRPT